MVYINDFKVKKYSFEEYSNVKILWQTVSAKM